MCRAAFLFLPSDVLHFNSPHAQLMYVNNRLMHAEREPGEEDKAECFLIVHTQTQSRRDENMKTE